MAELSDRELRILGYMIPPDAYQRMPWSQIRTIARREGVTPERIQQQASKLMRTIREAQKGGPDSSSPAARPGHATQEG